MRTYHDEYLDFIAQGQIFRKPELKGQEFKSIPSSRKVGRAIFTTDNKRVLRGHRYTKEDAAQLVASLNRWAMEP